MAMAVQLLPCIAAWMLGVSFLKSASPNRKRRSKGNLGKKGTEKVFGNMTAIRVLSAATALYFMQVLEFTDAKEQDDDTFEEVCVDDVWGTKEFSFKARWGGHLQVRISTDRNHWYKYIGQEPSCKIVDNSADDSKCKRIHCKEHTASTKSKQLPFTDLPGHILENIISCVSLTALGRLEVCHKTLGRYCEKSPQWALGVAAFSTVNRTAGGEDVDLRMGAAPYVDALQALDPRTSAAFVELTPKQQFLELMQLNTTCTGNLLAALTQYMPLAQTGEGSSNRFGIFMQSAAGEEPLRSLPTVIEALAALEAADLRRYHRLLDLIFLSSAREELADGPHEFARVFAGAPFLPVEGSLMVFLQEAGAPAPLPFWRTSSAQEEWDDFYTKRVIENLDGLFRARGGDGLWTDHDHEGLVLGGEMHMKRLLEPVGPAVLFGDALVKLLDCVAACKHLCSGGASFSSRHRTMACPTSLRQLPLTDLPGHILENIMSCVSLTSLGRLEGCHRILAPYCEKAPQWALGVAAFDTVNMTAGGKDEYFNGYIRPFMKALHAFDPRMGTVHSTLSPRQQFSELMQFHAKCTGNLLAALGPYMPLAHYGEGSWDRFALFKFDTTHQPSEVWS
ncbi:hypothetical protein JKP88DRAFT_304498 [Tribonema minus]|uniref:F-box domain-containing protein n=1 Tax=Tribonema minus TaxID=303371 RepID=A0A835ZGJ9_9STRA|nr:hypothetical protein JKP88DRAFT_304498 [Tribonema minus]